MGKLYVVALALAVAGSAGAQDHGRAMLQEGQSKSNSNAGQRAVPATLIPVPEDLDAATAALAQRRQWSLGNRSQPGREREPKPAPALS